MAKQSSINAVEDLIEITPEIRLSKDLSNMDSVQLLSKDNSINISVGNDIQSRAAGYILQKFYNVIAPYTPVDIEFVN